jgi:hypothetical protein
MVTVVLLKMTWSASTRQGRTYSAANRSGKVVTSELSAIRN